MLEINPGLMIWTIVTFLILLVLLKKFAWAPLVSALQKREEHIRLSIDQAEAKLEEARQISEENKRQLAKAEEQSQKLMKEGRDLGEKIKNEIMEKAHQQSRHTIEQAKLEIEREREAALLQLRSEVASLAITAAGKILDETLDADKHKKVVDSFLNEMPKN
jgi:F-type H+-transporting ATPase subunit b